MTNINGLLEQSGNVTIKWVIKFTTNVLAKKKVDYATSQVSKFKKLNISL